MCGVRCVWVCFFFLLRNDKEVVCLRLDELDKPDDVGVVDPVHDLYLSLEVREVLRSGARLGDRLYGVALPGNRVWKRWVVGQNTLPLGNNPKLASETNHKQTKLVFDEEKKKEIEVVFFFCFLTCQGYHRSCTTPSSLRELALVPLEKTSPSASFCDFDFREQIIYLSCKR